MLSARATRKWGRCGTMLANGIPLRRSARVTAASSYSKKASRLKATRVSPLAIALMCTAWTFVREPGEGGGGGSHLGNVQLIPTGHKHTHVPLLLLVLTLCGASPSEPAFCMAELPVRRCAGFSLSSTASELLTLGVVVFAVAVWLKATFRKSMRMQVILFFPCVSVRAGLRTVSKSSSTIWTSGAGSSDFCRRSVMKPAASTSDIASQTPSLAMRTKSSSWLISSTCTSGQAIRICSLGGREVFAFKSKYPIHLETLSEPFTR